jgi:hypothetical protein
MQIENLPKDEIIQFCRRNDISRLALFGSFIKGRMRPESDIDVLVEFHPGKTPGLFTISRMEREFSAYFGGKKIDFRTPMDLSRYFREEVQKNSEVLYAEG